MRKMKQKEIEKKERIKAWYDEGVPISEIANRLGCEVPAIYYHIRSMGIYRSRIEKEKKPIEPKIVYDPMDIEELDYSKLPKDLMFNWKNFPTV